MALESIPPTAKPKISNRARLQTDKVTGKPVLLYPEGALLLNPTAHAIALLCNGTTSMESIVLRLTARYQCSSSEIAAQVGNFLNRLREKNLIELA
jgi:coenzyme PQQ biosynthesis protein PqqD